MTIKSFSISFNHYGKFVDKIGHISNKYISYNLTKIPIINIFTCNKFTIYKCKFFFGRNANKKMQNYHKKKTTITNLSYNLIKISYNKFP